MNLEDMADLQFGGAVPAQAVIEEPRILFLHLNASFDLHRHLRFYKSIATVFDSEDDLRNRLVIPDRLFTVFALLPDQVLDPLPNFNPIIVEPDANVDYIYLLYKTHLIYATIMRDLHQELAVWHSTSDNRLTVIILIISESLDRSLNYYEERALRSRDNGDFTLAALYEQLQLERNQLQIAALEQLLEL
ncbi:unnamed protein product [Adineta steineri]|uniref:Uncharacterized protein n=1 Tax=Adineta steineri TaxID=433720 RepID=A0A815XUK9_9BILA|nr:unnamed protein product [Adineta steineri]CAF1561920.1 unnamed protein product [Adineta steineri]